MTKIIYQYDEDIKIEVAQPTNDISNPTLEYFGEVYRIPDINFVPDRIIPPDPVPVAAIFTSDIYLACKFN